MSFRILSSSALSFDPPSLLKTAPNCGWRLKFSFRFKELTDGMEISIKVYKRWDKCLRGEDDITSSYIGFYLPGALWKSLMDCSDILLIMLFNK